MARDLLFPIPGRGGTDAPGSRKFNAAAPHRPPGPPQGPAGIHARGRNFAVPGSILPVWPDSLEEAS